jgi:hypothetical protein
MRMLAAILIAVLAGCATSESLHEAATDAETIACENNTDCVHAGQSNCTCVYPVNTTSAESINNLAKRINCKGVIVDCASVTEPRCEERKCMHDKKGIP